MYILRNCLFIFVLLFVFVGCSNSNSGDVGAESSSTGEDENNNSEMSDLEDWEDEFGITEGDDAGIPARLPSDIYVTDDMEIEYTVENEMMSQLNYKTDKSFDELRELYRDYLNGSSTISEVEENVSDSEGSYYLAVYSAVFEGDSMDIILMEDESVGEYRIVEITRYDDEVVDEMIKEMQEQLEED